MIKSFTVKNYKALRDVTVELTPVHVLIGPNDAGKTSFLEAVAALSNSVDRELIEGFPGRWKGTELVWGQQVDLCVLLRAEIEGGGEEFSYQVGLTFDPAVRSVQSVRTFEDPFIEKGEGSNWNFRTDSLGNVTWVRNHWRSQSPDPDKARKVHDALSGYQFFRLYPRHLALPGAASDELKFKMWPSGFGLVQCLDDLLSSHYRERFDALEKEFVQRFPEIEKIGMEREKAFVGKRDEFGELQLSKSPGKGLYFKLKNGPLVPASQVSDGVLIVLAYLTILHIPQPPRILMIEEPENGVHPKRLEQVVQILKDVVKSQQHTQLILTTHSPYLLDYFSPEEVTFFKKGSDGAVTAHQLSKSKAVKEQIDLFNLGEIWSAEGEERLAERVDPSEAKRS